MSELVECPVCHEKTSLTIVNRHLDTGCRKPKEGQLEIGGKRKIERETVAEKRADPEPDANTRAKRQNTKPLAEQARPQDLDDFVGQEDLVGPRGLLRSLLESDKIPSAILWGPSGIGKTSFARIIANKTHSRFIELSATSHGISECKKVIEEARNDLRLFQKRTILFMDEIHRFNKAQQDVFLPAVEHGDIVLIGATTENPSFRINGALLSRCRVFVMKKLSAKDIEKILQRALRISGDSAKFESGAVEYLASLADGDGRIALNLLEICMSGGKGDQISQDQVKSQLQRTHLLYDRVGDSHYDTISAFHKSVRGSNQDAALFYLGRMLEAGEDPLYLARRMIRIASEDIGTADDSCLPFAVSTYTAVQQVGMPEADCILAHCAVKLASAPKSVKVYRAYNKVKDMLKNEPLASSASVPIHLRNAPTRLMKDIGYGAEYKYNPDYKDGRVKQDYLPEPIKNISIVEDLDLGTKIDPDVDM